MDRVLAAVAKPIVDGLLSGRLAVAIVPRPDGGWIIRLVRTEEAA
jgi:hypothetical protein